MSNILIINGAKKFAHSNGELNDTLTALAEKTLQNLAHNVSITRADSHYLVEEEVEKYLWADIVIYQMPGWWMGAPWTVKKYIDEVFTAGHGYLYKNDGRTRSDITKKYGSGGLLNNKKYMISVTWNVPKEAFINEAQFFHGAGIDGVYLPFHKANQFLGMQKIDTFLATDVIKAPDIAKIQQEYENHLIRNFSVLA